MAYKDCPAEGSFSETEIQSCEPKADASHSCQNKAHSLLADSQPLKQDSSSNHVLYFLSLLAPLWSKTEGGERRTDSNKATWRTIKQLFYFQFYPYLSLG